MYTQLVVLNWQFSSKCVNICEDFEGKSVNILVEWFYVCNVHNANGSGVVIKSIVIWLDSDGWAGHLISAKEEGRKAGLLLWAAVSGSGVVNSYLVG